MNDGLTGMAGSLMQSGRNRRRRSHSTKAQEFDERDRALSRLPLNDLGNAERLMHRFGGQVAHTKEHGWIAWDGRRWNVDDGEVIARKLAQRTAAHLKREAAAYQADPNADRDRIDAFRRFVLASGNSNRIGGMLREAEPDARCELASLDARADLLTVANGTLDLAAEGELKLLPFDPAHRITRIAPTDFAGLDILATHFQAFLAECLPDAEERLFLQRWCGYCLTSHIGEQVLMCLYGLGANGKSTFLEIVRRVLGAWAMTLKFQSIMPDARSGGSAPTPDLARLPGARLVTAAEPNSQAILDEGLIKQQTGGEPILARRLNREFFEFRPTHKLILSFNNKPHVRAVDEGTWRRILMLHWRVQIPLSRRDPRLAETIVVEESSGVLAWMLVGHAMWREEGLNPPATVLEATREYRRENDPLGDWIECHLRSAPNAREPAGRLYEHYKQWTEQNAREAVSANRFGRLMTAKGYRKLKSDGTNRYLDVVLEDVRPNDASDPSR
ncbi:MAG: hypothetical protein FJX53_05375 [Alphaproteobacteria bacterium]|nr:hypothetical protein [Alphaproteobacteria bacterium]